MNFRVCSWLTSNFMQTGFISIPFKTKSGENIKLKDLLDEAEERALAVVTDKNPDLPETERREIARVVGLGAVKYSDLLPHRQSDYAFNLMFSPLLVLNGLPSGPSTMPNQT